MSDINTDWTERLAVSPRNNLISDGILAACRSAIIKSTAQGNKGHAGVRGQIREILASDIIESILPPEVRIASGQIISSEGQISSQVDIALYARSILPAFLFDNKNGHIPIESSLYIIEVKSKLNNNQLKLAISNASGIRSFSMLPTDHHIATGDRQALISTRTTACPLPINALFAFSSNLTDAKKELDRYRRNDPNADSNPAIQVICICGVGYFYHSAQGWQCVRSNGNYEEVLQFLSGTANTIPQMLVAKGRPRFGNYLVQGNNHEAM
jgi:hypothetical protein